MIKTFYIQANEKKCITDVLSFPYEDYTPVEANTPLPYGIMCGAYELRDGQIIYRPEWDRNAEIERLKEVTDQLLLAQLEGGII